MNFIGKQIKAFFRLLLRGIWFTLRGKRALITAPLWIALLATGFVALRYRLFFYDVSDGTRTGIVRKVSFKRSSKGMPFCRYVSVEMVLPGSTQGGTFNDVLMFTVDDENPNGPVVAKLNEAERSAKPVTVVYRQDLHKWWSCSESEYFVTAVQ